MVMWILLRGVISLYHLFKKKISSRQFLNRFLFIGIISCVVLTSALFIWQKRSDLFFLLNGLGVFGQSAHSYAPRFNGLIECFEIFLQNPWLGVGLGGVDPLIAQHRNVLYSTLYNGLGTSILGEALLANGVIGLIPFVGYFYKLLFGGKRNRSSFRKAILWALVFEMGILCFNQNILRIYVWCLIGVLSAVEYGERPLKRTASTWRKITQRRLSDVAQ